MNAIMKSFSDFSECEAFFQDFQVFVNPEEYISNVLLISEKLVIHIITGKFDALIYKAKEYLEKDFNSVPLAYSAEEIKFSLKEILEELNYL